MGFSRQYDSETSKAMGAAIEAAVESARSGRLPGKWGYLQDLIQIWAPENQGPSALIRARQVLQTVGILRQLRGKKEVEPPNAKDLWVKEHPDWRIYGDTPGSLWCWQSLQGLPRTFRSLEDQEYGAKEVTIHMPGGRDVVFLFNHYWSDGPTTKNDGGIDGPFFKFDLPPRGDLPVAVWRRLSTESLLRGKKDFAKDFRDYLWSKSEFGYTFYYQSNPWDGDHMVLAHAPPPNEYVPDTSGEVWASLNSIVERCRLFSEANESRKLLYYGPPGTGKTTLARKIGSEIGGNRVLRIETSAMQKVNDHLIARYVAMLSPKVIVIDDLDRNGPYTNTLLHYLETVGREEALSSVVVIGTVNAIGELDPALLRPGRFDEVHEIGVPSAEQRDRVVTHYLDKYDIDVSVRSKLVDKMEGFAPADIREVLSCIAKVGIKNADSEIERVNLQRELHSGTKVEEYFERKKARR